MRKPSFSLPLGIGTANWLRDPQLLATGGFGLAMLPRDMAKIGYLYLRNGQWGKIRDFFRPPGSTRCPTPLWT